MAALVISPKLTSKKCFNDNVLELAGTARLPLRGTSHQVPLIYEHLSNCAATEILRYMAVAPSPSTHER